MFLCDPALTPRLDGFKVSSGETLDEFNPSNAVSGYFRPKHKDAKIFEKHLRPVMLVFIGKLSLSILSVCQGFSHFFISFA